MVRWLTLTVLLAWPAHARHTKATPATDYSAYTLNQWEWRVGPFRNAVGVYDGVSVGVFPLMFVIPKLRIANVQLKWQFWQKGPWAAAARLGLFRYDASAQAGYEAQNDGEPFAATAFPLEFITTYRAERSSWNFGLSYTPVRVSGSSSADNGINGAIETALLTGAWEWRWTEITAIVLEARIKLSEKLVGGGFTVQPIDDDSYLEIHGGANAALDQPKGNLSASFLWSWDSLNLRLGLAYGHLVIPVANVFFPDELLEEKDQLGPIIFPELDLFWRF